MPVSLALSEVSLAALLHELQEDYEVYSVFDEGTLHFVDYDSYLDRRYTPEVAPLEAVLMPVAEGVSAAQVAAGWCTQYASPRGSAAAMGEQVMFRDTHANIVAAGALLETLRKTAPPEDDDE